MTVSEVLQRLDRENITRPLLSQWLTAEGELQEKLFRQARQVRREQGLEELVLRGVIEISNFCQKNCDYCAMRAVNSELDRYRLTATEILAIAEEIKVRNISTVFLQSGQDPRCEPLLEEVIPGIKQQLGLNILLCLGERPQATYQRFAELGADSYILKFESSDPNLYETIAHTPLARRLQCLRWLQEAGFQVGTGNIIGLPGQTLETLVDDILLAIALKPNFVSTSPFIPNQETPLESLPFGNLNWTLNTMAIYRILLPNCLIPTVSALEKIQKDGQLMGLNAGANVMTINFTPPQFRDKYAIYSKQRFVVSLDHTLETIQRAGLRVNLSIDNAFKSPVSL